MAHQHENGNSISRHSQTNSQSWLPTFEELAASLIKKSEDSNIPRGGMTEWQGTALEKRQARKGLGVRIPVPPPEFANPQGSSEFSQSEDSGWMRRHLVGWDSI